jgi:hypothetical protein
MVKKWMGQRGVVERVKSFGFLIQNTQTLNQPLEVVSVNLKSESVVSPVPNRAKEILG